MKVCIKCHTEKPLSDFHTSPRCKDGHYNRCRDCVNKRTGEIYNADRQATKAEYYSSKKNDPEFKKKLKDWHYTYIEKNPHQHTLRSILNNYLKPRKTNRKNGCKYEAILGYGPDQLKQHIESQFISGMTWENRGLWHIDHKKPISTFSPNDPISVINSLDNLRPVWKEYNLKRRKNGI
jgi:hypothetical protein